MDPKALIETRARAARAAARAMALCPTKTKNEALQQMARGLVEKSQVLLEANRADVERARGRVAKAFLDRLTLTESRIEEMAQGLREIAGLPDPVGAVGESWRQPNGLEISRVRVPLGVIGFIYESRPNVTADAAGLCVKSGNAVVLRGGSEAIESNIAIATVLAKALDKVGAPADAVQFVDTTDRAAVAALLELDELVDLIIPRGGEELVRWVSRTSRVPVLKHDQGVLHVFVDAAIDHIASHGTGLAEAIVTNDLGHARRFTREVDAAAVLVNASTRLVDGGQFGMGAEMGISTSRVHARGPVGVRELTTTKFVVQGDGQVRD